MGIWMKAAKRSFISVLCLVLAGSLTSFAGATELNDSVYIDKASVSLDIVADSRAVGAQGSATLKQVAVSSSNLVAPDFELGCTTWVDVGSSNNTLRIRPIVSTTNSLETTDIPLEVISAVCEDSYRTYFVRMDNTVVATLKLSVNDNDLGQIYSLRLFARKFRKYSIGIEARDFSNGGISVPNQERAYINPTDTLSRFYYYPHDWDSPTVTPNLVALGELAMPALSNSGLWFGNVDHEPSRIHVVKSSTATLAQFKKTVVVPSKIEGDTFSEYISARLGDTLDYQMLVTNSYNKALRIRFPEFTIRNLQGAITHIQYKAWAGENRSLTEQEFSDVADNLESGIDHVVVRKKNADALTSETFKAKGIQPYFYQFLGAVRIAGQLSDDDPISIEGHIPKSWFLRPTTGYESENNYAFNSTVSSMFSASVEEQVGPVMTKEVVESLQLSQLMEEVKSYESSIASSYESSTASGGVEHGSWILLDIRQKEVREFLVSLSVTAVERGWSGVFFDGTLDWTDPRQKVGGDGETFDYGDQESISWIAARAKLLQETKAAIKAVNPDAVLGVLSPGQYTLDFLNIADFAYREKVNSNWVAYTEDPRVRVLEINDDFAARWEGGSRWHLRNDLFVSVKSANTMLMRTGLNWFERDSQFKSLRAYEVGDFDKSFYQEYTKIVGMAARSGDSGASIVDVFPPQARIVGLGQSVLMSDISTVVTLDRPAPIWRVADRVYLGYHGVYSFLPEQKYLVLENYNETYRLWWSPQGIFWRSNQFYVDATALAIKESPVFRAGRYVLNGSLSKNGEAYIRSYGRPAVRVNSKLDETKSAWLRLVRTTQDASVWKFTMDRETLKSLGVIDDLDSEFTIGIIPSI